MINAVRLQFGGWVRWEIKLRTDVADVFPKANGGNDAHLKLLMPTNTCKSAANTLHAWELLTIDVVRQALLRGERNFPSGVIIAPAVRIASHRGRLCTSRHVRASSQEARSLSRMARNFATLVINRGRRTGGGR